MPNGSCGVVSFGIKGGREAAVSFMENLQLASIVTHVADLRTCVLHPASTTHRQLNDQQLEEAGVSPDLIRFSVGIEKSPGYFRRFGTSFSCNIKPQNQYGYKETASYGRVSFFHEDTCIPRSRFLFYFLCFYAFGTGFYYIFTNYSEEYFFYNRRYCDIMRKEYKICVHPMIWMGSRR